MKLLCVTETSDRPESALITGLGSAGVSVDVVCRSDSPWKPLFEKSCHQIFSLDVKRRIDIRAARQLRRIVVEGNYDLVHAFTGRTVSAMVLGTMGLHCSLVSYRGTVGHLSRLDPTNWFSFLSPSIDRTMCVSNAVRTYMLECGVPPERAVTVYKGHQPEWYSAAPRSFLHELGVAPDDIVATCVATIRPVKGVDVLLRAMKLLPRHLKLKLILVGEVRDNVVKELLKDAAIRERVIALGHRQDATEIVGASDIAILPSREREGFPKAILEAMSLGRPVIASAVGGIPEIITDSLDGFLAPSGNSQALASRIVLLAEDAALRERLGNAGKETVKERFSVMSSVQALLALYGGIPKRARNRAQDSVSV